MPVKIFENNYIAKTGTRLPRVYIDKVVATNDSEGAYQYFDLEITLACYIQKSLDILNDDFNTYVADIIKYV